MVTDPAGPWGPGLRMGEHAAQSTWDCNGETYTVHVGLLRRLPMLGIATSVHGPGMFRDAAERIRALVERSGMEFPRMRVTVLVERRPIVDDDRTAVRLADRTLRLAIDEGRLDLAIAWTIGRAASDR